MLKQAALTSVVLVGNWMTTTRWRTVAVAAITIVLSNKAREAAMCVRAQSRLILLRLMASQNSACHLKEEAQQPGGTGVYDG